MLSKPRLISCTSALIALNFIAWFVVAWGYHLSPLAVQNSALLLKVGAVNGELLRAGEWWRIITSQFLHVHFAHLVFNMAALFLLGGLLEREYGSWRLLIVYVASGVVGQLVGVAATPALVSSGASQAVMGLAGWTAVELLRRHQSKTKTLVLVVLLAVTGIRSFSN